MSSPERAKRVNRREPKSYSDLKPGQQATLFPSLGYYDAQRQRWRAFVHGRVFIDGRIPLGTRLLLRGLKKAMKATPEDVASETFQQRIDGFLAAPGRRRRIVLEIHQRRYRLKRRTRRNGAFYGHLSLPRRLTHRLTEIASQPHSHSGGTVASGPQVVDADVLDMRLLRSTDSVGTIASTCGKIYLVPPRGISVISDIDDTIKMTEATCRSEMLANTFLRPFEVVEGMSQLYQQWRQQGCAFHYVSSSPWELFEPLSELCESSQFPSGSMHLRYFRVRDEMFKRFRPIRRNSKVGIIASIIKHLPERQFILVGDSGEKDPEIYRFLARRFRRQVAAVLIRDLVSRPLTAKRRHKLETISSEAMLRIYRQSQDIASVVAELQRRSG